MLSALRLGDVDERAHTYNELNQLVEDYEHWYDYDLDGNMVLKVEQSTGDSTRFHWNEANRQHPG